MTSESIHLYFEKQQKRSLELRSEPLSERKNRLKRLRSWLMANKESIHIALYQDLHKSATEADISELFPVASELNKAISHLSDWARAKPVSSGLTYLGTSAAVMPEPKGVCLIIAPWNYPFQLLCAPLVSCLAAGNTAILKPSENTPATSKLISKMVAEVFDPSEVIVVEGAVDETTTLLKLPFDHIFFTGSTAVGKIVMEAAAKNLTSVTLELGGKSPTVIDESADLKDAAKKIAWGKYLNCGQTCIAPDYILVHESKKEAFINLLKQNITMLFDEASYAHIVNDRHAQRMVTLLKDAVDKGAKIEIGGVLSPSELHFEPTVISDVDESCRIWQEEIFGPILPIRTFQNLDEVINSINAQPKPLALYLFSQKKSVQRKVAKSTSSGSMVINDVVLQFTHPNLSFGGVNHSGIGKSHGYQGFLAFSNEKSVLKQRVGFTIAMLLYPPYTGFKKWLVNVMMRWF